MKDLSIFIALNSYYFQTIISRTIMPNFFVSLCNDKVKLKT